MMNNTYSLIISQSERAWSFQWARTLFALERRLTERERTFYLRKYSISVVSDELDQPEMDRIHLVSGVGARHVPGLMIIRRMEQTRAEKRRRIVDYWQVSCRDAKDAKLASCAHH